MKMNKSKFIVVEGIDGSGKTTNIPVVTQVLADLGVPYIVTQEPGGTDLGQLIRSWVKSGEHEFSPDVLALLLCTARAHHIDKVILPALKEGVSVVCDRFWGSTLAYQGGGMGVHIGWLTRLSEMFNFREVSCDLELLFDVPISVAKTRLPDKVDYFDNQGEDFFKRVVNIYQGSNRPGNIHRIDANKPIDEVAFQVREAIHTLYSS